MQSRASFFSSFSFIQTFFYPDFYEQIKPSLFSHNDLIPARAV